MLGSFEDTIEVFDNNNIIRKLLGRDVSQVLEEGVSKVPGYDKRYTEGGALDIMFFLVYGAAWARDILLGQSNSRNVPEAKKVYKKPEPCATDHLATLTDCSALLTILPVGLVYGFYTKIFGKP